MFATAVSVSEALSNAGFVRDVIRENSGIVPIPEDLQPKAPARRHAPYHRGGFETKVIDGEICVWYVKPTHVSLPEFEFELIVRCYATALVLAGFTVRVAGAWLFVASGRAIENATIRRRYGVPSHSALRLLNVY